MKIFNNIFICILSGYILAFIVKCLITFTIEDNPAYLELLYDQSTIIIGVIGGITLYLVQKINSKKKTETKN